MAELTGWHAIGAEQAAGGYQVAWKTDVGEQYSVWTTDSNGNYLHNLGGTVPGNHPALLELEPRFGQDLNSSSAITAPVVIETAGSTDLVDYAGTYFLYAEGTSSGPQLKYGGVVAAAGIGQLTGWHATGVEQVAGGYQVVWKTDVGDQYSVWTTDSNGNFLFNLGGVVAGNHPALISLEPRFGQDLNGSGAITSMAAIETAGATDLVQIPGTYFFNPEGGGWGPQLKLDGAIAAASIGPLAGAHAIGVEQVAGSRWCGRPMSASSTRYGRPTATATSSSIWAAWLRATTRL